jgi:hypothetical protein
MESTVQKWNSNLSLWNVSGHVHGVRGVDFAYVSTRTQTTPQQRDALFKTSLSGHFRDHKLSRFTLFSKR